MTRLLLGAFLIAHGALHPTIYTIPYDPEKTPFNPGRSWALAAVHVAEHPTRTFSAALSVIAGVLFLFSGIALLISSSIWVSVAATGAVAGLVLKALYFHPWLSVGVLIDVAVLWAAAAGWPPSLV
ncbi:MAG TPA: hypothetical protein VFA00_00990 [Actinomycetota bacterium]|nr:hypothetical protein [Actinomycetota bacterium]